MREQQSGKERERKVCGLGEHTKQKRKGRERERERERVCVCVCVGMEGYKHKRTGVWGTVGRIGWVFSVSLDGLGGNKREMRDRERERKQI